jgi:cephalosporin-C deacetylase-like acetyl esterase
MNSDFWEPVMKRSVEFYSEGCRIGADLVLPDTHTEGQRLPAVILCHGFSGIRTILLPPYADELARNGFAALLFDYRGFGDSEGERGRLVPAEQRVDIRNAITFMQSLPEVDPDRIGLWGTSFGGANAICTAAIDTRVKCLSVQITFGSGERMVGAGMTEEEKQKLHATLDKAWQRTVVRNKPMMLAMEQILTDEDSKAFYAKTVAEHPEFKIKLPLTTIRESLEYCPEDFLPRVHVPIMLIGATDDIVCPVSEMRSLYDRANAPRELFIIEGARHYDVYEGEFFKQSCGKAVEWYKKHL